eukprot:TRINITY_DN36126_c0_g1_i1.p1 TRINITY_DN36126_c0_g1~~TRINITY_DN36126_c0_g1_i1.p1  ORF type:complete len:248 (+),score=34.89 TRINITY_DN36126_c0_g1_i1:129-872(+)
MADGRHKLTQAVPLYNNQHFLDFDWGVVTAAFLQKFPDPDLKYVKSVETVNRVVCPAERTMDLRRLFYCTYKAPKLAEKLLGKRTTVVCVEEAHWDLAEAEGRRLTVHGRNETGQSVLRIEEVCCYTEVAPGRTLYTQSATVAYRQGLLSGLFMPMAGEILAGVCQRNAHKGLSTMIARCEREKVLQSGGSSENAEAAHAAALRSHEEQSTSGRASWLWLGAGILGLSVTLHLLGTGARRKSERNER